MNNKKIIFGLFCLSTLILGACANGGNGDSSSSEEHVHVWGEPEWSMISWTGLTDGSITATFTCTLDPTHTHIETSTISGGGIVLSNQVPATCTEYGSETYTTTVNFNNQTYTHDVPIPIPPLGHPEIDDYGFCEYCDNYLGIPIGYNEEQSVNLAADESAFYRFADPGTGFEIKRQKNSNISDGDFKCYRINENGDPVQIVITNSFASFARSKDGYYYIVIKSYNNSVISGGTFSIEKQQTSGTEPPPWDDDTD